MFFKKKKEVDLTNIIDNIYSKDRLIRSLKFLVGVFIVAFSYNVFMLPSNIVYGVGGIGVILNKLYGITPAITIFIGSMLLLILSYFTLGKEKTAHTVAGSVLYPIFVQATSYYTNLIDLGNLEPVVIVIVGAVMQGIGLGLIFKAGYTTGGTDILNQIASKFGKMSMGSAMILTDGLIILVGLFIFNFQIFIYSLVSLYIISVITDKVILGISRSKTFYIITENETTVKKFLMHNLSHGVTVLNGRGGYTGDNQKVIMCIIPTREYYVVKEGIKQIDPKAFFLVTDAYEVSGGA